MKKLSLLTMVLALAVMGCSQPTAQKSDELVASADAWAKSLNAGDLDALVGMYTEDCRLLPPNAEGQQGLEAVRAAFSEMVDAGMKGELVTTEAIVAGDVGYRIGTFSLTVDGAEVDRGKFIETWKNDGGTWKIANDIWNSDLPAAPPPGTTLAITHEVRDADKWLAAWQGPNSRKELFAQNGIPNVRVFQSSENPKLTGLLLEVADMEAFEALLNSPEGTAAKKEDGVRDSTTRTFTEVK